MAISETERLLAVRAALTQTVNTHGWTCIKQMTVEIQGKAIDDALQEDDPVLGESKRQKARGIQYGFNTLFSEIEKIISSSGADSELDQFSDLNPYGNQELEDGR